MNSRRIIALLLSVIITILSFTGCSLSEVGAPQNGNKPHNVNVTFDFNYDGCPEQVQIVAASGKANEELVPEREGFTFTGWFLDKRARTPYDFESILTCSVCKKTEGASISNKFCPNCGAKMDGDSYDSAAGG